MLLRTTVHAVFTTEPNSARPAVLWAGGRAVSSDSCLSHSVSVTLTVKSVSTLHTRHWAVGRTK